MTIRDQWALFVCLAAILGACAWANFWNMLLGADSSLSLLLMLAGWCVSFRATLWLFREHLDTEES